MRFVFAPKISQTDFVHLCATVFETEAAV